MTKGKAARDIIKELRALYRDTLRRERTFYWVARIKPLQYPLMYVTWITDGATQANYVCPKLIGTSLNRDALQMKLVGNILHAHMLVFHLVMPHIKDDANLFCHCLDTSLVELRKLRIAKGQPAFLPVNWRSQIDGVSTQWGKTAFAHHQHLVDRGALGENTDVARNKVRVAYKPDESTHVSASLSDAHPVALTVMPYCLWKGWVDSRGCRWAVWYAREDHAQHGRGDAV